MAQGISPNNLNKISQVYLSQISEHHKKDADGNTIPHEDENIGEAVDEYGTRWSPIVRTHDTNW